MHKNIHINFNKVELIQFYIGDAMASRIAPTLIRLNKKNLLPALVKDLTTMCKNSAKELMVTLYGISSSDFSVESDLHFSDDGGDNLPLYAVVYVNFSLSYEVPEGLVENLQKALIGLATNITTNDLFNSYSESWTSAAQENAKEDQNEQISNLVKAESEKFLQKHGGKQVNSSVKIVIPKGATDKEGFSQTQKLVTGTLYGHLETPEKRLVENPVKKSYAVAVGYIDSELKVFFRAVLPKFSNSEAF